MTLPPFFVPWIPFSFSCPTGRILLQSMATPAQMQEWIGSNAGSDLVFIWEENDVPLAIQYALGMAGFKTLRKFVGLEDDKTKVRAALVADFALDPGAAVGNRLILSSIVTAWEIAQLQLSKETLMRAEAKVSRLPRPISNQEQISMRRLVEIKFGVIPASEQPSSEYLSTKLEEVESNNPSASRLDEITSMEDGESQSLTAQVGPTGSITVLHKKSKSTMPVGPEAFRMRLRFEAHLWLFLAAKFANRVWLVGLTPQHFSRYADHFLGTKCNGLSIPCGSTGSDSSQAVNPPWQVVLNYEYACRKGAFFLVREKGATLKDALEAVLLDSELKEIHFTSAIVLMPRGSKRNADEPADSKPKMSNKQRKMEAKKGAGKGKGKGKGKGAGKGALVGNTPDGRQICFAYNSATGCQDASCARVHVCRKRGCQGTHPLHLCTMP